MFGPPASIRFWLKVVLTILLFLLISNSTMSHRYAYFKFLKMWLQNLNCMDVIKSSWVELTSGYPMLILKQKLKQLSYF